MSIWQPIKTAPKSSPDGDFMELIVSEGRDLPTYVAYWDMDRKRWIDPGMVPDADAQFENAPKWWMPIPELPDDDAGVVFSERAGIF